MRRTRFALVAFLAAFMAALMSASLAAAQDPVAGDFEKVTLDDDTQNPMEMDIATDGRVFYVERDGRVQVWNPATGQTSTAGTIPVTQSQENGLLGITLANDFDTTGHLYLSYSALPDSSEQNRLSRFTIENNAIVAGSERVIYTWQHQVAQCCHTGGSLATAPDGSIYISTGDNTNPFDSSGFAPIDERPGREYWDAQRTSANTNNANGKILHLAPVGDPTGTPGAGTTYTIPANNLFASDSEPKTMPEIYAMGFRNPFRITVDPKTGWVLMGDYGPDAGSTDPNRGPQGSVEFNVVKEAGNYGWPYCIRQNVAYNDYDFATGQSGAKFNCDAPVNTSPNNTGITNLPPAKPATMWEAYSETDTRFPQLGTGGAPTGGPRYDFDPDLDSPTKFPEFYDGRWFIGEWNNGWIKTATLGDDGAATGVQCWVACNNSFPGGGYLRPMDMEFGPDGSLYVIEWGSGFGGNNPDSGIYRIDYTQGDRRPVAHAAATPDSGPTPLEVQFSSEGSNDPEGTEITYEWDFDGDGTTDSTDPNPSHTYATAGNFSAKLTVTDAGGLKGTDSVPIVAGNSRPEVTIDIPEDGKIADFGDIVPFHITVSDAEDGSTTDGGIDCDDVTLNVSLGHDQHAHELSQQQGCEGTFETGTDGGHGAEANIFTVIEATYTDSGGTGVGATTGRAQAILQPKLKQAEYYANTGRVPGTDSTGDAGVQKEATTDTGGGQAAAFIEDGDWISFTPYNLEDLSTVSFRVASAGAGGRIELRSGAADGPLVATADVTPTGGWQNWTTVTADLHDVPDGTHDLFIVFRNDTDNGSLMNLNWFRLDGKGAAISAPPIVSATATPASGEAPLEVAFDSTAEDPEGDAITYAWDFGVPGTGTDVSTEADPSYTYTRAGTFTAKVTVTDANGAKGTATVPVTVTGGDQCPTGGLVDDFDGTQLGAAWTVIRPDQTMGVSGGTLNIPAQPGDIYADRNDAKNLVTRAAPAGAWTAVAKLDYEGTTQYHQAGIMVYGDDDNFIKFGRLATDANGNGDEKFEFILENAGTPRNEAADSTANLPAGFPRDYWVRLVSDGTNVTGAYSTDGATWTTVGRPAPLPADAKLGLFAFSNNGTGNPVAKFDSFTLSGAGTGGGGGTPSGPSYDDQFDGSSLDTDRWNAIVRPDAALTNVAGGKLTLTTSPGDIYTGDTTPPPGNFVLQSADHAGADWTIETKIDGATIDGGYGQGGLLAYVDGDNYVKLDAISDVDNPRINRLELRSESGGTVGANPADPQIAAGVTTIWLRLTKSGENYSGAYSLDGTTWTAFATPVTNAMATPAFGVYAIGPQAAGQGDLVPFEYFTLDGADEGGCSCAGDSNGDEFDGASLDKTRWNAIANEDATKYTVAEGGLKVTTVAGDMRNEAPNLFLQSADHAGPDWEIETKLSGTIQDGYQQGGLVAWGSGADFVKLDAISDVGFDRINRIELRSQVGGTFIQPQPNADVPTGTTNIWLRLKKTGTTYQGSYSFDGTTWTTFGDGVQNAVASPRFGLYTVGVNAEGGTVTFDSFKVDGQGGCTGEPGNVAPVIGAVTASRTIGLAPLAVDFTAAATDADDDELSYSWDFGDGTPASTQQNPSHTYQLAGTHTATVTVSDGEHSATKSVTVTVLGADDGGAQFRALVFSKTTGFRHDAIPAGIQAVKELGQAHDFQVDATEDASVFTDAILSHYDVVVFMSTTGDPLNAEQQAAFERYIRAGGGYAGVHAAADTEYDWHWYGGLVGAYFRNHPAGTPTATVNVEDPDNHSTQGLPSPWQRVDEWYNYRAPDGSSQDDYSPRAGGVHVLIRLDEATYDEDDGNATDDDHPISWCQRYDGGRSWYTGMGHTQATYADADFRKHLLGGLELAAGKVEDADCGIDAPVNGAPSVTIAATPVGGEAPLGVNFTATGTDPDGDPLTYAWDFGDGTTGVGATAGHVYASAGTYTVKATVSDGSLTGSSTVTITVTTKPPPEGGPSSFTTNDPSLKRFRKHGLKVTVECGTTARGTVSLTATPGTAAKLRLRNRRVGSERISCRAGGTVQVSVLPSKAVRKAIQKYKPQKIKLDVALALQNSAPIQRTVTIRR
ncbi:MAG: ThuA domain-containing protein [Solirubrobacteraceae bacterium]